MRGSRHEMLLSHFLKEVRPGSGKSDDWSWEDEARQLLGHRGAVVRELMDDIEANGQLKPVLIGNDGRLWDGHHRVVAHMESGAETIWVERVPSFDHWDFKRGQVWTSNAPKGRSIEVIGVDPHNGRLWLRKEDGTRFEDEPGYIAQYYSLTKEAPAEDKGPVIDVEKVAEWLSTKGTTLWGRGFDVNSADTRRVAAEWLRYQIIDFQHYVKEQEDSQ